MDGRRLKMVFHNNERKSLNLNSTYYFQSTSVLISQDKFKSWKNKDRHSLVLFGENNRGVSLLKVGD